MTEQKPDTLLNPAEQINANYQSGKINAADTVLQDVGEAARQTNDALMSPWSPLGWINKVVQDTANVVATGAKAVVDPIAKAAGGALRTAVGAKNADAVGNKIVGVANAPVVKSLEKTYSSPQVAGDIGAFGNIANLVGTVPDRYEGQDKQAGFPANR